MALLRLSLVCLLAIVFTGQKSVANEATSLEIGAGKRVAFVGNSLAERMNLFGHFETHLQIRFAETKPPDPPTASYR